MRFHNLIQLLTPPLLAHFPPFQTSMSAVPEVVTVRISHPSRTVLTSTKSEIVPTTRWRTQQWPLRSAAAAMMRSRPDAAMDIAGGSVTQKVLDSCQRGVWRMD
ncbi:hypothetical protein GGR58DRAFT_467004 [Xylaria digitata]|nr:hypothetical protein GGR58DRAFT_467004 [Xylaria digitata]